MYPVVGKLYSRCYARCTFLAVLTTQYNWFQQTYARWVFFHLLCTCDGMTTYQIQTSNLSCLGSVFLNLFPDLPPDPPINNYRVPFPDPFHHSLSDPDSRPDPIPIPLKVFTASKDAETLHTSTSTSMEFMQHICTSLSNMLPVIRVECENASGNSEF